MTPWTQHNINISHRPDYLKKNACLLSTDSEEHPSFWQQCQEAMLRTPHTAWLPQAGRDEGCWCRNKSFHSSWMLPHRIWALSHMWAAPSSLRRSLPVLDRNICEDPWPSQDSSSSIIFVGHTLCRRDLQRVYLPPSHHTGRSSFNEGSRAQEGWPVVSREVQLWL